MGNFTNSFPLNRLIPLWNRFTSGSTNQRIFGAALIVGFFTFSVKIASLLKELVVASAFGTSDALDAFLIASLLPSFVVSVVAGSLNAAMIPTYIQVREQEGSDAAQKLLSSIIVLTFGIMTAAILFLVIIGPFLLKLMGSGFDSEKLLLAQNLFFILLPIIILNGLITIYASILNAEERFALAAFIPAALPFVSAITILLFASTLGAHALAYGFLAGYGLQLGILTLVLKKKKIRVWPKWSGMNPHIRQVIDQYLPMVTGALMVNSTLIVDQSMAAMLEPGSVASLGYGNKMPSTLLGIGAMALGTAVLPYYSKMVANEDWKGIDHTLKTYRWKIIQVTIPITLLFYFFSEPIIQILFERGAFTSADTALVSEVQAMYILQVPFYVLAILTVRLISSLKYNKLLMYGSMISLPLNIIFNYILMKYMGVAGIALSTTLVYAITLIFLSAGLNKKLTSLRPINA